MYWTDLPGSELMRRVYSNPPFINEIDIFSIDVKRDGPTVIMSFDLVNSLPDKTPDKWGKDFNRCRAGIYCFGVSDLNMQGIETDMVAKVDIKIMDNKNIVSIKNNDINIKIICSHISLTGPSVYISK
ncbi:immunity 50 family protein [Photorhabdus temperata]|uniref:immunity 50 family protein n=1 Tax=Photorhabdus TaxID=29487 RepID=UPI001FD3A825|nr:MULTISPECIES: immunity 50 family protein [Photorhabdus]MCT8350202.1 immunity 50 family protein [Photorhabdus temperata]